jgi:peptidoglycan-associated lipoprotein
MKASVRTTTAILAVPLVFLLAAGCSKKAKKPADKGPEVSQSVLTTKPSPRSGADGRSMSTPPSDQSSQLLALRGEDIPISDAPTLQFIEPSPEDRLVLKNIYFDFDKSTIKGEFQQVLEGIAGWLNQSPEKQLLIEGHCDERGTNEYNLALGERRSLSVRRYLVGLGISPDRLHTISYGEEKPADPGHGEASWSKNRRAEFKVSAN